MKTFKQHQEDYDRDDELEGKKVIQPAPHMPKDSGGKLDLTEPKLKDQGLQKLRK